MLGIRRGFAWLAADPRRVDAAVFTVVLREYPHVYHAYVSNYVGVVRVFGGRSRQVGIVRVTLTLRVCLPLNLHSRCYNSKL